jgi:hypothetical protein
VLEPLLSQSQRYNSIHCFKGHRRRRDKIMKGIKEKKMELKDEKRQEIIPLPPNFNEFFYYLDLCIFN